MKNPSAAVLLTLSALLAFSSVAHAQPELPKPCKTFPPPPATPSVMVRAYLRPLEKGTSITGEVARNIIAAVSANIEMPKPLDLPMFAGPEDGADKLWGDVFALPEFTGEIGFRLKKDGSVDEVKVVEKSFSPKLEQALLNAVRFADSSKAFSGVASGLPTSSVLLGFRIDAGAKPDSLSVDLFEMQMPSYLVTRNVHQMASMDSLRLTGQSTYDGEITVEFVVDENGRVPPHTFKAQANGDPTLRFGLRGAISQLRYSPAMAGGCPVFHRVQQKFIYKAGGRPGS